MEFQFKIESELISLIFNCILRINKSFLFFLNQFLIVLPLKKCEYQIIKITNLKKLKKITLIHFSLFNFSFHKHTFLRSGKV